MSEHKHTFAVHVSCECGLLLSTLIQSQHSELASLRAKVEQFSKKQNASLDRPDSGGFDDPYVWSCEGYDH